jgi:hypothetical protein
LPCSVRVPRGLIRKRSLRADLAATPTQKAYRRLRVAGQITLPRRLRGHVRRGYVWVIAALLCGVQPGHADAVECGLICMGISFAGYCGVT